MRAWKWMAAWVLFLSLIIYGVFAIVFAAAEAPEVRSPWWISYKCKVMSVASPQGRRIDDIANDRRRVHRESVSIFLGDPDGIQFHWKRCIVGEYYTGFVDMDTFLTVKDMEDADRWMPSMRLLAHVRPLFTRQDFYREIFNGCGHFTNVVHKHISAKSNFPTNLIIFEPPEVDVPFKERALHAYTDPRLVSCFKLASSNSIGLLPRLGAFSRLARAQHGDSGGATGLSDCLGRLIRSYPGVIERLPNEIYANGGQGGGKERRDSYPKPPQGHLLLGLQVLASGLFAIMGCYLLLKAREQIGASSTLTGLSYFLGGLLSLALCGFFMVIVNIILFRPMF